MHREMLDTNHVKPKYSFHPRFSNELKHGANRAAATPGSATPREWAKITPYLCLVTSGLSAQAELSGEPSQAPLAASRIRDELRLFIALG